MQKVVMHIGESENVRTMIKNAIRENDLLVSRPDAQGAAQWFRLGRMPHLIVCEMNLPGMSGHHLLGAVKRNKQLKDIPFVFFTSYISPSDRQVIRKAGALDCYRYSSDPTEFIEFCQELLQPKQSLFAKSFSVGAKTVDRRPEPGFLVRMIRKAAGLFIYPLRGILSLFISRPVNKKPSAKQKVELPSYSDAA
ncbi:MAG: response regulator [Calditrichota bacterium]